MFSLASRSEIIWTDLEATVETQGTGWGVVARTGDARMAASATFSHDGSKLLYSSGTSVGAGVTTNDGDLHTVPWNSRNGGTATKVPGASEPSWNEYYPILSPDDELIAFDRVPQSETSYNNAKAEVFVIPTVGGTPTRLAANDPPSCSPKKSPGITNSWPKWSPETTKTGTRTFYWITFSSTRGSGGNPQLYVAPIVRDDGEIAGTIKTYPALYLWNQPPSENNHTPAWDKFQIPVQ
jgi:hypothetical protein